MLKITTLQAALRPVIIRTTNNIAATISRSHNIPPRLCPEIIPSSHNTNRIMIIVSSIYFPPFSSAIERPE
jgi:hypothetical protein